MSLRQVGVRYPGNAIGLHPTDIGFGATEITVLLGLSGAGKSTLLRAINHLARPTSGTVRVAGIGDLTNSGSLRRHRRQTAMIFQQHQLIQRMTALANVLVGRLGQHSSWRTLLPFPHADRRLALDCLARVGLAEKALKRCDTLSGGEQQRVGIARALAQGPKLILADEPVASLDPATAGRVLSLLRGICREVGIPAIISLHQVSLAREFADRIVGLADGRVVFDGRPEHLSQSEFDRIYGAQAIGGDARPSPAQQTPPTTLEAMEAYG